METAAAMLTGRTAQFWAQSYGGDPFAPGPFWSGEYVILLHDPDDPERDEAYGVFTEEESVLKADDFRRDLDADGFNGVEVRVVPFQDRTRIEP